MSKELQTIEEEEKDLRPFILQKVKAGVSFDELVDLVGEKFKKSIHTVRYHLKVLKKEKAIYSGYYGSTLDEKSLKKFEAKIKKGLTIEEACFRSGVNYGSLYYYFRRNPEYKQRIDILKTEPTIKAKEIISDEIDKDNIDIVKMVYQENSRRERQKATLTVQPPSRGDDGQFIP